MPEDKKTHDASSQLLTTRHQFSKDPFQIPKVISSNGVHRLFIGQLSHICHILLHFTRHAAVITIDIHANAVTLYHSGCDVASFEYTLFFVLSIYFSKQNYSFFMIFSNTTTQSTVTMRLALQIGIYLRNRHCAEKKHTKLPLQL